MLGFLMQVCYVIICPIPIRLKVCTAFCFGLYWNLTHYDIHKNQIGSCGENSLVTHVDSHSMYGDNESMNRACEAFNGSRELFDFGITRDTFYKRNKKRAAWFLSYTLNLLIVIFLAKKNKNVFKLGYH